METPLKSRKPTCGWLACSAWLWLLPPVIFLSVLLTSCGGGGETAQGPPPASGDFSLSIAPTSVSIQPGGSTTASLSATGSNGFDSNISIQLTGSLPTGVTVSPLKVTVTPGTPQTFTFSASTLASVFNTTVTFTGTSGSLTHSAQLAVAVVPNVASNTPPFRMRYVRTDATTPYFEWQNSSWIIYNPPTSRFFVTDPDSNRIFALDSSTEAVVGTVWVPGAFGIDDTPDHLTLYVGTQIGDLYAIDPVGMTVTKRYLAAQIGPKGFSAYSARVMADGRLALLGGQGGIPGVDGYGEFVFWNPVDNSLSANQFCVQNIGVFTRTPDRTKVVIVSIDSDGTLCEVDEATGSANSVQIGGFIWHVVFSPDGQWITFPAPAPFYNQAEVYDANTLGRVAMFNVSGDTSSAAGFFVSADSKTLYTPSDSIVYAYDLATGQQTGWFPNIVVELRGGGSAVGPTYGPNIQAMDTTTGLVAGPLEEGVGFLDLTTMRTGAVGTQFLNGYLDPATGPTAGGTPTSWSDPNTFGLLQDIYFGSQKATSVSGSSETISATTPSGVPGPADVYTLTSDGGVQFLPEAFSYGPTVLEITPNAATADGGIGFIYGYGFGPVNTKTVPSDLQVTVGGKPATISNFGRNVYGVTSPPFPLEGVVYNIPAGMPGTTADVSVSAGLGTVTVHSGITYLPAVQQHPLAGAALAQGIYDSQRDVYYFTDAMKIQVFSRTAETWMTPISVTAADPATDATLPPPSSPQRLWGIALSPDGSKLAIADAVGDTIYVLNPDSPSAVKKFPVPQPGTGAVRNPVGVAISDAGIVYFTAATAGGDGYGGFFKLDTNTGRVTDYGDDSPGLATDTYLRTIISSDNSRVYFNNDGEVFSIDTATDQISEARDDPGCCYGGYDLSLSSNQARFAATGYFYDSDLNAESYTALNLREMNVSDIYGEKLSPDGSVLFQPTTNGIDVLDARLGNLLMRIALPMTLSPNYDALVSDGKDNVLVAITGANGDGVAVIDLTAVPEPPALPYGADSRSKTHLIAPGTDHSAHRGHVPVHTGPRSQPRPARRTVRHVTAQNLLRGS